MNTRVEDTHYALIPMDNGEDSWHVRILQGEFSEVVIAYGAVSMDEQSDMLNFNFDVISTPLPDITSEDVDLQLEAGDILSAILHDAVKDYTSNEAHSADHGENLIEH
jgi:hypothetical protein